MILGHQKQKQSVTVFQIYFCPGLLFRYVTSSCNEASTGAWAPFSAALGGNIRTTFIQYEFWY